MCTRVLFTGSDNLVITGRSMDWLDDPSSNLWSFSRGMKREGGSKDDNCVEWISKYGCLGVSFYEKGLVDGINEAGLVVNALYLAESDYGTIDKNIPTLSILCWTQYFLDNYCSVEEAVNDWMKDSIQMIAPVLPNGKPATAHLSISDPTGDSAVIEYIDGQLIIHHSPEYKVMTNSPQYDDQLALERYWESIGGLKFLPGTISAADRFARASYFINALPKERDENIISSVPRESVELQQVAGVLGTMRAVSVPLGIADPDKPNISSTLWRTIYDQKNSILTFDSATSPNAFWVKINELDFSENTPVKKLTLSGGKVYAGNVSNQFLETEQLF
jgi:penicillin V acylase-like amidase (Ntn superfamily)